MANIAAYQSGKLKGEFFDDVLPAFSRWKDNGKGVYVYSNGSEQSQREMFRTAPQGDLRGFVDAFFDTAVIGSKYNADSYKKISNSIKSAPSDMLFLSDVLAELDAADKAGCPVLLVDRPGNKAVGEHSYRMANTFQEL